jgi:hypothetical protein
MVTDPVSIGIGIGIRLQGLAQVGQVLVLGRLAEGRSPNADFSPSELKELFFACRIPPPKKISNVLASLRSKAFVLQAGAQGRWSLTPTGRRESETLVGQFDLVALTAEIAHPSAVHLGHATHPTLPPTWAPPELLAPVRDFLDEYPFDRNVFAMTRFPDAGESPESVIDPVAAGLAAGRHACASHGLTLHVASDRMIVDDLWGNVMAHVWACRYGIAFIEDRRGKGLNYNLTIEVGGMLLSGRRTALLKDHSIKQLPSDLVGKIYKSVDLSSETSVTSAVHTWLRDDLALGDCVSCAGG